MRYRLAAGGWLAACLFLAGCGLIGPSPPRESGVSAKLEERLREINALFERGQLRKAIARAELALVDHHDSGLLKDKLAQLRQARENRFRKTLLEAENAYLKNQANLAIAILKEVDQFGDDRMIHQASAKSEEYARAVRAVHSEPN